jgi:superoxide reductase
MFEKLISKADSAEISENRSERRNFLKAAAVGAGAFILNGGSALAQEYFPVQVDETLWKDINRVKDPNNETTLEKLHVPVITAPEKVKAGEVFNVDVIIGREPHPMMPAHWIEYIQFSVGNEPAGTVTFRSHGYLKAVAKFAVVLDETLKGKKVSLVATLQCNLHGIWQNYVNVEVV